MPTNTLTEHLVDWNELSQVDPRERIVANVALTGSVSRNGYRYAPQALERAVTLYDRRPVFLDHPQNPQRPRDRSTRDLVGTIFDPRYEAGRIRGDIRVLDTEAGRTFLSLAGSNSPGLGMSHVVLARRSADGSVVESIEDVISVDAVVNPATTHTFREQHTLDAEAAGETADADEPAETLVADRKMESLRRQVMDLEAEVERLRTCDHELQKYRRNLAVEQLLEAAGLPTSAVTELFRHLLRSAPNEEYRRWLIEERLQLLQALRPGGRSVERTAVPGRGTSGDAVFVMAIRGRS